MINFEESKWYRATTVIWDVVLLGLIWTLFSLPLVTIGASTTALYYLATKKVSGVENDYIFAAFWKSFKENFVKSTVVFLLLVVAGGVAWFNLTLLPYLDMGAMALPVRVALFFVLVQVVFVATYVFAIIARFETTSFGAIKAAFFIANRHIVATVTNFILLLAIIVVVNFVPVLLLFMMGIHGYFASFMIVRLFRKHYPAFEESIDELKGSEEDE